MGWGRGKEGQRENRQSPGGTVSSARVLQTSTQTDALRLAEDRAKYHPSPCRLPAPQPSPRAPSPASSGAPWECRARQWAVACVCLPRMRTFSGPRQEPVLLTGKAKGWDVTVPGSSDPHPTGLERCPSSLLTPWGNCASCSAWPPKGPQRDWPSRQGPCPPPSPVHARTTTQTHDSHSEPPRLRACREEARRRHWERPAYIPGQLCPLLGTR